MYAGSPVPRLAAAGPEEGGTTTSQGHPYTVFRRALERGDLLVAEATAKELPRISLADALELTVLIAREDPGRHSRVAAGWLLRYLEERPEATIETASMVARVLAALGGEAHTEAARTLRAISGRYNESFCVKGLKRGRGAGGVTLIRVNCRKPFDRHRVTRYSLTWAPAREWKCPRAQEGTQSFQW